VTVVRVDVTDEYLSRLFNNPLTGLLELIENSLDADASEVRVTFERSDLGAIERITISDNGDGITKDQAVRAFGALGGSWKLEARSSRAGRPLRGRKGHGRWAAFAVGETVVWTSRPRPDSASGPSENSPILTRISGGRSNPGEFDITEESSGSVEYGTTVTIDGLTPAAQSLDSESTFTRLNEKLGCNDCESTFLHMK
jgi:HSP90 family molecular chaperone